MALRELVRTPITLTPGPLGWLRVVLVAAQAATIVITWPLWQVREAVPNLPLLRGLPGVDVGAGLLGTLLLVLVVPRWGIVAHGLGLLLAIELDQLRLQPECVSLALLLAATWPRSAAAPGRPELAASGLLLARAHLVALYVWAGLHKLLSADYPGSAERFWTRTLPWLDESVARAMGYGVALFELLLGLLLLWPPARRSLGWLAGLMHVVIFVSLSPLGRGRNEAVWPWNLALAVAAPLLLASWQSSWRAQCRAARPAALCLSLVLLLSPALYYVGRLDAYLAHCLYSVNVPVGVLARAEQLEKLAAAGRSSWRLPDLNSELKSLRVPFPPAHRLFEQYFRLVGRPGDELHVRDPRAWAARQGRASRVLTWAER